MSRSLVFTFLVACSTPTAVSGGFALDVQPNRPQFMGAYDFDIGGAIKGHACVTRANPYLKTGASTRYWFLGGGVERISNDPLVVAVVGAAVLDAIAKESDVDSMVVTRVVITSKDDDQTCADAWGRGVTLTKGEPPRPRDHTKRAGSGDEDDGNASDDDDSAR